MNLKSRQRGALIIVAIGLLVVTAVLATALSYLSAATNTAGVNHNQSAKALAIAQAGLERTAYQLGLAASPTGTGGTACATAALNNTNVAVGSGTFTTTSTLYQPAIQNTTAAMTAATTIIPVTNTNYAPHGRVRIGNEEIDYSGKGNSTAVCGGAIASCLIGTTRGVAGTTAAASIAGTQVKQDLCLIRSTGTVGTTKRIVEQALHDQDAMIIYSKDAATTTTPFYRRWGGAAWGIEQSSATLAASGIQFTQLKFARTRNEAIMGLTDANGRTSVQVWDGFTWGNTQALGVATTTTTRNFDIAYETGTDRAVVVYNNNTRNPLYRVWSGSAWSAAGAVNTDMAVANYTTGVPNWIVLSPNPLITSNEIAMITLDASSDITGARWNGSSGTTGNAGVTGQWQAIGAAGIWEAAGASATSKAIDVAYEQLSGRALFVWAYTTNRNFRWRTWSNPTLSGITAVTVAAASANPFEFIRLVGRPNSNQIMFAGVDNGRTFNTRLWDGIGAGTFDGNPPQVLQDNNSETNVNRAFDVVFETHPSNPGKAWLAWGSRATTSTRTELWTPVGASGTWGAAATQAGTDRTDLVQLFAHPSTGNIFAALYEATPAAAPETLNAIQLTSGSGTWSATTVLYSRAAAVADIQNRASISGRKVIPIDWQEIFP